MGERLYHHLVEGVEGANKLADTAAISLVLLGEKEEEDVLVLVDNETRTATTLISTPLRVWRDIFSTSLQDAHIPIVSMVASKLPKSKFSERMFTCTEHSCGGDNCDFTANTERSEGRARPEWRFISTESEMIRMTNDLSQIQDEAGSKRRIFYKLPIMSKCMGWGQGDAPDDTYVLNVLKQDDQLLTSLKHDKNVMELYEDEAAVYSIQKHVVAVNLTTPSVFLIIASQARVPLDNVQVGDEVQVVRDNDRRHSESLVGAGKNGLVEGEASGKVSVRFFDGGTGSFETVSLRKVVSKVVVAAMDKAISNATQRGGDDPLLNTCERMVSGVLEKKCCVKLFKKTLASKCIHKASFWAKAWARASVRAETWGEWGFAANDAVKDYFIQFSLLYCWRTMTRQSLRCIRGVEPERETVILRALGDYFIGETRHNTVRRTRIGSSFDYIGDARNSEMAGFVAYSLITLLEAAGKADAAVQTRKTVVRVTELLVLIKSFFFSAEATQAAIEAPDAAKFSYKFTEGFSFFVYNKEEDGGDDGMAFFLKPDFDLIKFGAYCPPGVEYVWMLVNSATGLAFMVTLYHAIQPIIQRAKNKLLAKTDEMLAGGQNAAMEGVGGLGGPLRNLALEAANRVNRVKDQQALKALLLETPGRPIPITGWPGDRVTEPPVQAPLRQWLGEQWSWVTQGVTHDRPVEASPLE